MLLFMTQLQMPILCCPAVVAVAGDIALEHIVVAVVVMAVVVSVFLLKIKIGLPMKGEKPLMRRH